MKTDNSGRWAIACAVLAFIVASPAGFIGEAKGEELWVTTGMWSHHNNEAHYHYNQVNNGLGMEVETSPQFSYILGEYDNSLGNYSSYFGVRYSPYELGKGLRLGATMGFISGYSAHDTSRYVPAVIPTLSFQYKNIGVNAYWMPSIVEAVQLKVRVVTW